MPSWINLREAMYPMGSIYLSADSKSPSSIIGGTWVQITSGFLACAGTDGYAEPNNPGGSNYISENQLPNVTGTITFRGDTANSSGEYYGPVSSADGAFSTESAQLWSGSHYGIDMPYVNNPSFQSVYFNIGSGDEFIPKHISIYVWRRTA